MKLKALAIAITVIIALTSVHPALAQSAYLSPEGGGDYHAIVQLQDDTQDNNSPDNPITDPELLSDCGQWSELGGHPCPQSDNDIIPLADTNRSNKR